MMKKASLGNEETPPSNRRNALLFTKQYLYGSKVIITLNRKVCILNYARVATSVHSLVS